MPKDKRNVSLSECCILSESRTARPNKLPAGSLPGIFTIMLKSWQHRPIGPFHRLHGPLQFMLSKQHNHVLMDSILTFKQ
jgi:hypothetical protein